MSLLHTPNKAFIESAENDTYIGFIDASACPNMDTFYNAIIAALQLPDYFGRNLDALDEVLCDLSWIDYTIVFLIIENESQLLIEEPEKISSLIEFFVELGNDNFEVVMK